MGSGRPSASARGMGRGGPVGLRILVPGWDQWGWGQRERGLVLFGSFASALGVGLFAWGTWGGTLLLLFAFGAHVTSAADVIRQVAFPGFGRVVPWASASMGLGMGCYAPALALASILAWPDMRPEEGYLVNRWAYWNREPAPGEWAWVGAEDGSGPRVVRVVASAGQSVVWAEDRLRVGGQAPSWPFAPRGWRPGELAFDVPEGFVLVDIGSGGPAGWGRCELQLVPRRLVAGRAWARLHPIWARHLLM